MPEIVTNLPPPHPIVIGVDGSRNGQAAVWYGVEEAVQTRKPLQLIAVLDASNHERPPRVSEPNPDWILLAEMGRSITRQHPTLQVRSSLDFGNVGCRLLARARNADRLVIGRRGIGTFDQPLLGSTANTLAARSDRPVMIVPADWQLTEHTPQPVVAGADLTDPNDTAILFGFEEARRRGVPLVVVHAVDTDAQSIWARALSVPAYRNTLADGKRRLEDVAARLEPAFPTVPVTLCDEQEPPATALLRRSREAQLLVLGRRDRGPLVPELGRTTGAALHYAEIPIAVAPG